MLMASCSAVRTPAGSVERDRKKRRAMATSAVNRAGTREASCPIAWYVKPRTAVLVTSDPEDVSAQQPISSGAGSSGIQWWDQYIPRTSDAVCMIAIRWGNSYRSPEA